MCWPAPPRCHTRVIHRPPGSPDALGEIGGAGWAAKGVVGSGGSLARAIGCVSKTLASLLLKPHALLLVVPGVVVREHLLTDAALEFEPFRTRQGHARILRTQCDARGPFRLSYPLAESDARPSDNS